MSHRRWVPWKENGDEMAAIGWYTRLGGVDDVTITGLNHLLDEPIIKLAFALEDEAVRNTLTEGDLAIRTSNKWRHGPVEEPSSSITPDKVILRS